MNNISIDTWQSGIGILNSINNYSINNTINDSINNSTLTDTQHRVIPAVRVIFYNEMLANVIKTTHAIMIRVAHNYSSSYQPLTHLHCDQSLQWPWSAPFSSGRGQWIDQRRQRPLLFVDLVDRSRGRGWGLRPSPPGERSPSRTDEAPRDLVNQEKPVLLYDGNDNDWARGDDETMMTTDLMTTMTKEVQTNRSNHAERYNRRIITKKVQPNRYSKSDITKVV